MTLAVPYVEGKFVPGAKLKQLLTGVAPMSKIYRVSSTLAGHQARLVRANNRQAAVNFVARDTLIGNLATQDELVFAITAGTKIEDASSPQLDDTLSNHERESVEKEAAHAAATGGDA